MGPRKGRGGGRARGTQTVREPLKPGREPAFPPNEVGPGSAFPPKQPPPLPPPLFFIFLLSPPCRHNGNGRPPRGGGGEVASTGEAPEGEFVVLGLRRWLRGDGRGEEGGLSAFFLRRIGRGEYASHRTFATPTPWESAGLGGARGIGVAARMRNWGVIAREGGLWAEKDRLQPVLLLCPPSLGLFALLRSPPGAGDRSICGSH